MPRAGKTLTPDLHKQTLTFAGAVLAQLPMISVKRQQHYIGKPQALKRLLAKSFAEDVFDPWVAARDEQVHFYAEVLGMEVSLSDIHIPDAKGDFILPLILVQDLVTKFDGQPIEGLFQIAKSRFPAWKSTYEALDIAIPTHERHPQNGSYAIVVRDRAEADEENTDLSAANAAEKKMLTETILERIFHELFRFWKHGDHLDIQKITLVSGSRNRDGHAVRIDWNFAKFSVLWFNALSSNEILRPRSVRV